MKHGEILDRLRKMICYNFTQADLARDMGISRAYLCDILGGKRKGLGPKVLDYLDLEIVYKKKGSK